MNDKDFNILISDTDLIKLFLEKHMEEYQLDGTSPLTDDQYDHMKRILKLLEPDNEFLQKVGSKPKKNKETLPFILGSLSNKFDEETGSDSIYTWLNKHDNGSGFILTHKLDGVAIECEYRKSNNDVLHQLNNAWLRGDHYIGENITSKVVQFAPIYAGSDKLDYLPDSLFFKGEILLSWEPETIGYKNKRNAVAGILNRDDGKNLDKLYVIFHTWAPNAKFIPFSETEKQRMYSMVEILGKTNVVEYYYSATKELVIQSAKDMIEEKTQYDKDGIVITVNNSEVENVKIPEKKIALKFNKQSAITTVKYTEWNISRTGKDIPLVYIEPVELGGITISKSVGFNAKFIQDNKVGPGAKIKVVRSGDVIPHIEEVIQPSSLIYLLPIVCNSCGTELVWDENKVHLICIYKKCPIQKQKKMAFFFEQLGLEEFGEKMITKLNCNSVVDVINLKKEDLLKIEGWGESRADDFLVRLQELRKTTPDKLLASLGIDNLGDTTSQLLLSHFTFDEIIDNFSHPIISPLFVDKLSKIHGIGPKSVITIINGLIENLQLINDLKQSGFIITQVRGPLANKSFCITGVLSKPRKEIEKWIKDNGGSVASISSCKYLICNEPSSSGKYKKALEKNIKIITEEELIKLI